MPTLDPSLFPAIVTQGATLFSANWTAILGGTIAIVTVVKLPSLVASNVIRAAFHSLGRVLRVSR